MKILGQNNKTILGEMLVRKGWLSQAELDEALVEQPISNKQLGKILVEKKIDFSRKIRTSFGRTRY